MVCVAHLRGSHIKFGVLDIVSMATMFACCQNFVLITNFCLYSVCRWPVLQPLGTEWLCQILALFHHHKRKPRYSLSPDVFVHKSAACLSENFVLTGSFQHILVCVSCMHFGETILSVLFTWWKSKQTDHTFQKRKGFKSYVQTF